MSGDKRDREIAALAARLKEAIRISFLTQGLDAVVPRVPCSEQTDSFLAITKLIKSLEKANRAAAKKITVGPLTPPIVLELRRRICPRRELITFKP